MNPKTKLKDYKYEIAGEDSDKPLNDCIDAIALGFYIAWAIFVGGLFLIDLL